MLIVTDKYLPHRARRRRNQALARLVAGRSPTPNPLVYDAELDALVQWLPLDLALPALAEPPESLREAILAAGHGPAGRRRAAPPGVQAAAASRPALRRRGGQALRRGRRVSSGQRRAGVECPAAHAAHSRRPSSRRPGAAPDGAGATAGVEAVASRPDVAVPAGEILVALHAQPHPFLGCFRRLLAASCAPRPTPPGGSAFSSRASRRASSACCAGSRTRPREAPPGRQPRRLQRPPAPGPTATSSRSRTSTR